MDCGLSYRVKMQTTTHLHWVTDKVTEILTTRRWSEGARDAILPKEKRHGRIDTKCGRTDAWWWDRHKPVTAVSSAHVLIDTCNTHITLQYIE